MTLHQSCLGDMYVPLSYVSIAADYTQGREGGIGPIRNVGLHQVCPPPQVHSLQGRFHLKLQATEDVFAEDVFAVGRVYVTHVTLAVFIKKQGEALYGGEGQEG